MRILLFLFLFISSSLFAQRDSVISGIKCHLVSESPDSGTAWIQNKTVTKKGVVKFRGVYWEFYPGGKLKAKGYFKNGKQYQKWIRYYPGGQKAEEGYYDKGLKSDLWMRYYENGKMSWKGNYFKNMRSGYWRYFYEDGTPKAMTRYRIKTASVAKKPKAGTKKGISIRVNREITYSISPADSLIEYYPDGKLRTRIIYGKEGGLNGSCQHFYPDGKINLDAKYLAGKETGEWIYYCKNGLVFKSARYSDAKDASESQPHDESCIFEEIQPWLPWKVELVTP